MANRFDQAINTLHSEQQTSVQARREQERLDRDFDALHQWWELTGRALVAEGMNAVNDHIGDPSAQFRDYPQTQYSDRPTEIVCLLSVRNERAVQVKFVLGRDKLVSVTTTAQGVDDIGPIEASKLTPAWATGVFEAVFVSVVERRGMPIDAGD